MSLRDSLSIILVCEGEHIVGKPCLPRGPVDRRRRQMHVVHGTFEPGLALSQHCQAARDGVRLRRRRNGLPHLQIAIADRHSIAGRSSKLGLLWRVAKQTRCWNHTTSSSRRRRRSLQVSCPALSSSILELRTKSKQPPLQCRGETNEQSVRAIRLCNITRWGSVCACGYACVMSQPYNISGHKQR